MRPFHYIQSALFLKIWRVYFAYSLDPETNEWLPFPTPYEFAQYLIDEMPKMGDVLNVNRHFAAQFTQCPFCSLPFDMVGKKETFDQDIQVLFENLELTDKCDPKLTQNKGNLVVWSIKHRAKINFRS